MKQTRNFPILTVSRKAQAAIEYGHPWVYEAEVGQTVGQIENGALVDILSDKGRYLGTGLYSAASRIRVRILSRNANDVFDAAFWERRIRYAWAYRKTVMGGDLAACRLIFGEADGFPGLTVDRFNDLLVTQTLSYGIEIRKSVIFPLLVKVLAEDGVNIRGVYERNDVALRQNEGLAENKGWFALEGRPLPEKPLAEIEENGVFYTVDVENGQKTGFFLDQKYNRAARVVAVDISESAVEMARACAKRNGLDRLIECKCANVFDYLPALEAEGGHPFDLIILDPPAFTKSRKTHDSALRGYKEITLRAMRLLPRGGYLATCSCSHFMPDADFCKMLRAAAKDACVNLRQIEARQQAPDHPILWNVPETDYLKFYIFQIV